MAAAKTRSSKGSSRSSSSRSSSSSRARSGTSKTGKTTTDHETIRQWVEERGGSPACVKGTGGGGDTGMLRIDFPGYSGATSLKHIDWGDWFEKFDEKDLAFLYQDRTPNGRKSNFNKLIDRSAKSSSRKSHGRGAR
jgi:hypothetical protein